MRMLLFPFCLVLTTYWY